MVTHRDGTHSLTQGEGGDEDITSQTDRQTEVDIERQRQKNRERQANRLTDRLTGWLNDTVRETKACMSNGGIITSSH